MKKVYEFIEDCQLTEEDSPFDSCLADLYGRVMDAKGWKDLFLTKTENEEVLNNLRLLNESDQIINYLSQTWEIKFSELVIK